MSNTPALDECRIREWVEDRICRAAVPGYAKAALIKYLSAAPTWRAVGRIPRPYGTDVRNAAIAKLHAEGVVMLEMSGRSILVHMSTEPPLTP